MSGTIRETDGALYMPDLTRWGSGLSEDLRAALVMAFQGDSERHAEHYFALGRTKSVELKDFLAERTVRTTEEWMHAGDRSSVTATSPAQEESGLLSRGPAGSASSLPMVAMISSWLEHWWFAWVLNEPSYIQALKKGISSLDGAEEYRRIAGLR